MVCLKVANLESINRQAWPAAGSPDLELLSRHKLQASPVKSHRNMVT